MVHDLSDSHDLQFHFITNNDQLVQDFLHPRNPRYGNPKIRSGEKGEKHQSVWLTDSQKCLVATIEDDVLPMDGLHTYFSWGCERPTAEHF